MEIVQKKPWIYQIGSVLQVFSFKILGHGIFVRLRYRQDGKFVRDIGNFYVRIGNLKIFRDGIIATGGMQRHGA